MPFRGDNPFQDIEQIFDRMSREFGGGAFAGAAGSVAVDVEERDDAFVVTADVPGYEKDDIDVTLADRTLRIRAERETETEAREADYLRRERRETSASRSVRLPGDVDEEGITATYKNGVLTVTLPKREGGDGHRIDVE
jgi:HSP20 family protein